MNVHHVTRFVVTHRHVITQGFIKPKMIERVFGCEVWRAEIVISVRHVDFEIRVVRHRGTQRFSDVDIRVLKFFVRPRMHEAAQNFVRQIGFKFQLAADVIVERGGIRTHDVREQWIVFGMFGDAEPVAPDQTRIEPTDGESAFAQEFLEVMLVVDAQIRAFDELLRDAREVRCAFHNVGAFFFVSESPLCNALA